MAIIIVEGKLSEEDFEEAKQDYETYIKITVDLEKEIVVLGGEYHADAEKTLLTKGSKQENIWGGGVNLKTKEIETNAIINLRTGRNDSTEIIDPSLRRKFLSLSRKVLSKYVKKR